MVHTAVECDALDLLKTLVAKTGDVVNKEDAAMLAVLIPHASDLTFSCFLRHQSIQSWAVKNKKSEVILALGKASKLDFAELYDHSKNILHYIAEEGLEDAMMSIETIPSKHLNHQNSSGNTPFVFQEEGDHKDKRIAELETEVAELNLELVRLKSQKHSMVPGVSSTSTGAKLVLSKAGSTGSPPPREIDAERHNIV